MPGVGRFNFCSALVGCSLAAACFAVGVAATPATAVADGTSMTWQAWATLGAILLLLTVLTLDLVNCCAAMVTITCALHALGIITSQEMFAGMSTSSVISIAALYVLVHPIAQLPAARRAVAAALGRGARRGVQYRPRHGATVFGTVVEAAETDDDDGRVRFHMWALTKLVILNMALSSFVDNAPQVALMTSLISEYCREHSGFYPSQFLMPMNFATLAGNVLITGTGSNLIVSSLMTADGMEPMRLMEPMNINGPFLPIVLVYLIFAPRLLLHRNKGRQGTAVTAAAERTYHASATVASDRCPLFGRTAAAIAALRPLSAEEFTGFVVGPALRPAGGLVEALVVGDVLRVEGTAAQLRGFAAWVNAPPTAVPDTVGGVPVAADEGTELSEINSPPNPTSPLEPAAAPNVEGRESAAAARCEISVFLPTGEPMDEAMSLRVLLTDGDGDAGKTPQRRRSVQVGGTAGALLERVNQQVPVLCFLFFLALALSGVDVAAACIAAVVAAVSLGAVSTRAALSYIDLEVCVMVGFSFGIGSAVERSGLASVLGHKIASSHLEGLPLLYVLAVVASVLNNVISGKAAIQVLVPLVISMYRVLGEDPRPAVMMICILASYAVVTPYGFATNLMVMGPGGYSARDFIVFGGPLAILAIVFLPIITYLSQ